MGREVDIIDPSQRKLLEVGKSDLLQADVVKKKCTEVMRYSIRGF